MFMLLAQDLTELNPDQLVRLAETFSALGLVGGALFVLVLLLVAVIVVAWINRNKDRPASEANRQLVAVIEDKEEEKKELKQEQAVIREELRKERELAREQHIESLTAIADAMNRHADISEKHTENEGKFVAILETLDKREGERTDVLSRLTDTVEIMTRDGSEPLRQLAREVREVLGAVRVIESQTTTWDTLLQMLPDLQSKMTAIKGDIDSLLSEAQKHSTQPLPTVAHVLEETP